MLEPAVFKLAQNLDAAIGLFDLEDQCGVGQAEELGEDDSGLAEAEVVGLQAGEDQVGLLVFHSCGEQAGCVKIPAIHYLPVNGFTKFGADCHRGKLLLQCRVLTFPFKTAVTNVDVCYFSLHRHTCNGAAGQQVVLQRYILFFNSVRLPGE